MQSRQLGDPCQMMVVMICYKKEEVHGAHRRFEPWVKRIFEYRLFVNGFQQRDCLGPYLPESLQELFQRRLIMTCLRRPGILQVCGTQLFLTHNDIIQPPLPQWFQVAEVSQVLLDGPGIVYLACQEGGIDGPEFFLQPHRRTPQSFQYGGKDVLGS